MLNGQYFTIDHSPFTLKLNSSMIAGPVTCYSKIVLYTSRIWILKTIHRSPLIMPQKAAPLEMIFL